MKPIIPTVEEKRKKVRENSDLDASTFKGALSKLLLLLGVFIIVTQAVPIALSVMHGVVLEAHASQIDSPVPNSFIERLIKDSYFDPGSVYFDKIANSVITKEVKVYSDYKKPMKITIPSVKINNVHVSPNIPSTPKSVYEAALSKGVAHLENTPLPGDGGKSIIYGHSGISKLMQSNNPRLVFTKLEKVSLGDGIKIEKDGKEINYSVSRRKIVDPDEIDFLKDDPEKEQLILITCWPIGIGSKRLVIIADIIN